MIANTNLFIKEEDLPPNAIINNQNNPMILNKKMIFIFIFLFIYK